MIPGLVTYVVLASILLNHGSVEVERFSDMLVGVIKVLIEPQNKRTKTAADGFFSGESDIERGASTISWLEERVERYLIKHGEQLARSPFKRVVLLFLYDYYLYDLRKDWVTLADLIIRSNQLTPYERSIVESIVVPYLREKPSIASVRPALEKLFRAERNNAPTVALRLTALGKIALVPMLWWRVKQHVASCDNMYTRADAEGLPKSILIDAIRAQCGGVVTRTR
jgi:hypothetical protein